MIGLKNCFKAAEWLQQNAWKMLVNLKSVSQVLMILELLRKTLETRIGRWWKQMVIEIRYTPSIRKSTTLKPILRHIQSHVQSHPLSTYVYIYIHTYVCVCTMSSHALNPAFPDRPSGKEQKTWQSDIWHLAEWRTKRPFLVSVGQVSCAA
jgi:hypothetical protein